MDPLSGLVICPPVNVWNVNLLFFISNILFKFFCSCRVVVCNVKWNVVRENSHCSALVFSSTDSRKTLLDPAHIILNYFFFIF